jgi:hypothetical protein
MPDRARESWRASHWFSHDAVNNAFNITAKRSYNDGQIAVSEERLMQNSKEAITTAAGD